MQIPLSGVSEQDAARFWSKVIVAGDNDCWEWTAGGCGRYGMFHIGGRAGRNHGAHRVAFALANGWWAAVVSHLCFNKRCVNPAHLRGDADDTLNARDADRAKLSPADADSIRRRLVRGSSRYPGNGKALADEYGVAYTTVLAIADGRSWR